MSKPTQTLEQRILDAAENNDDCLNALLQEAVEAIADEEQLNLLLDRVLQVQREALSDLRGWRQ